VWRQSHVTGASHDLSRQGRVFVVPSHIKSHFLVDGRHPRWNCIYCLVLLHTVSIHDRLCCELIISVWVTYLKQRCHKSHCQLVVLLVVESASSAQSIGHRLVFFLPVLVPYLPALEWWQSFSLFNCTLELVVFDILIVWFDPRPPWKCKAHSAHMSIRLTMSVGT